MKKRADASISDEELEDGQLDPIPEDLEEEDDDGHSDFSIRSGKRGRPRIQECWTGVINASRDAPMRIRLRVLATDLLLAPNLPGAKGKFLVHWQPYFFPKAFAKAKE